MAVAAGSLDAVDHHIGKIRIACQRYVPLNIVVKASCAGHVNQNGLVAVAFHQAIGGGAGQRAHLVRGALLCHGAAGVYRVARLIDAQTILIEGQGHATTFCYRVTHDRLAAHGVDQVERYLVANALGQILGAHDGHGVAGLAAAETAFGFCLLGHGAGQAVQRGLALHVRSKKPGRLNLVRQRGAVWNVGCTHSFSSF